MRGAPTNGEEEMVIAAVVGVVVGLISLIPFCFAAKNARKIDPSGGSLTLLAPLLLTLAVSFVILVLGLVGCKMIAPDYVVACVVAEFATFVIGVIVFGIKVSKRR